VRFYAQAPAGQVLPTLTDRRLLPESSSATLCSSNFVPLKVAPPPLFASHVRPGPDGRAADVPRPAFRAGRPSGSTALAGRLHPMAGSGGGGGGERAEGAGRRESS